MDEFTLIFDNPNKLVSELNYNYIHVVFDEHISASFKSYILNLLKGKKVTQSVISIKPQEEFILNLPYKKEDFVLAVGGLQLQSIVKYYAYMHYIKFAIIPAGEVAEYTFSRRAFIRDKYYCFYECEKPQFVHIFSTLFSDSSVYNLYKILSYKNIVNFEREFCNVVFDAGLTLFNNYLSIINSAKVTLKEVIKIYAMLGTELDKYKTYDFLGLDYQLLSLGDCNNMVQSLIECHNILAKFYTCIFKFDFFRVPLDVNLHLKHIKNLYNISAIEASKKAMNIFSETDLDQIIIKLKAYKPHLELFLEVCKNNFLHSNINLNSKGLQRSLALCADLYPRKNLLRVALELGYFENLVKDL